METKINWQDAWKDFDEWAVSEGFPDWLDQKRKIGYK
jgi:hypothetical protein